MASKRATGEKSGGIVDDAIMSGGILRRRLKPGGGGLDLGVISLPIEPWATGGILRGTVTDQRR